MRAVTARRRRRPEPSSIKSNEAFKSPASRLTPASLRNLFVTGSLKIEHIRSLPSVPVKSTNSIFSLGRPQIIWQKGEIARMSAGNPIITPAMPSAMPKSKVTQILRYLCPQIPGPDFGWMSADHHQSETWSCPLHLRLTREISTQTRPQPAFTSFCSERSGLGRGWSAKMLGQAV